jgi:hypothetical protein
MSKIPSENISELDFLTIRKNLIDYVKNSSEFKDYDFEASGLNFVVDLLSYNTQYQSYYLNQVASELFLDTAQKRKNAASIAKQIGYLSNAKTASKAEINFRLTGNLSANYTKNILAGTKFLGKTANGNLYPFISETSIVLANSNQFTSNITLTQGTLISEEIVVNNLLLENKFEISSKDIDLTYLTVHVRENELERLRTKYNRVFDITLLTEDSEIFYIEQNYNGKYQIIFGDGILGKIIKNNNVIELNYLVTSGEDANECVTFDIENKNDFVNTFLIETIQFSSQGEDEENADDIRNNARKLYFSQNRTVTEKDYQIILMKYFPFIESISVWGGEKNTPPLYGSVFCAIKPKNRALLSNYEIDYIKSRLDQLNVITILPRIVNPEYTYIKINANVVYDSLDINMNQIEIVDNVKNVIFDYSKNNLLKFYSNFQLANITKLVDDISQYFMGSYLTINLYKKRNIEVGIGVYYNINFNNKIKKGSLTASRFDYIDNNNNLISNCYLKENSTYTGVDIVFTINVSGSDVEFTLKENIGKIDYDSGIFILEGFSPTYIREDSSEMTFEIQCDEFIIIPSKEQILTISIDDIYITPSAFIDRSSTSSNLAKAELFDT